MSQFEIWQRVHPPRKIGRDRLYRIVEVVPTVDGYRSRLTTFCFETVLEAANQVEAFEKEQEDATKANINSTEEQAHSGQA